MENILALLCVIDWLANDLHYRSSGPGFYEKHLLADRIRDFGDAEDQIKEIYYLGFKGQLPPFDVDITKLAQVAYQTVSGQTADALGRLCFAFEMLLSQVEAVKREDGLPGGVHAVLDDVSKNALAYKFLANSMIG